MIETINTGAEWTLLNYQDGNSMVVQSIARVTANEARNIRRRLDYVFLQQAQSLKNSAWQATLKADVPIRYVAQWLLNRLNENMPEYADGTSAFEYVRMVQYALSNDVETLVSDWLDYNDEPNEWSTFMEDYETENPTAPEAEQE